MGIGLLTADGQKDLTDVNPSDGSVWFAPSASHTSLQPSVKCEATIRKDSGNDKPISASARQHLIDAKDVEGVDTDSQVEGVLSGSLGDVLVGTDASSFESFA